MRIPVFLVACAAMSAGLCAPTATARGIPATVVRCPHHRPEPGRWVPAVVASSGEAPRPLQGLRVVDVVRVGDPRSERDHEYAGEEVTTGASGTTRFIQTRAWMRYSLTTYDDTQVTVRCTFHGSEGRRLPFELLVDGRSILTQTFVSASATPSTVDAAVPMSVTKGKTVVSVMIRAVNGPTPALITLQTIQEHLERPAW